jgi:hypothetical protein
MNYTYTELGQFTVMRLTLILFVLYWLFKTGWWAIKDIINFFRNFKIK